ncbi:MAG: branched-chain amino acid transport [Anaerolineaceae bacterium]|nr:branched-chain amino acid transport [Anaerolineaceae bacterium]
MNELLLVAGMALVTVAIRYPTMAIFGRIPLPDALIRALRYVPVAVLTAIIVPLMIMPDGEVALSLDNAFLIGGIAATVIAWRTKNLLLTIVLGMAIFLIWRAVI